MGKAGKNGDYYRRKIGDIMSNIQRRINRADIKNVARVETERIERDAVDKAFLYMLSIPLVILQEDYWKKTAKQRMPKFIDDVMSLYESVSKGIVTNKELADSLYESTGIRIEAEWLKGGVSDDVCEWRIVDRPHNLPIYNTSCGKIRLQYATGIDIYCNGCGKKIKMVE